MLVKATKAMTDLLRKNLNLECIEMIKLCKFSESEFSRLVDYNSYNRICDYSLTTGKFSVIKIIYKSENQFALASCVAPVYNLGYVVSVH